MTLVDSSSWVEALRPSGNPAVRKRVANLLDAGEALWCDMVRIELWRDVRAGTERRVSEEMDRKLRSLKIDEAVWKLALALMKKSRTVGYTAPATDVLIVATAAVHRVPIEHCDTHLDRIAEFL